MRITCWNIRAGGGRRAREIAEQIEAWRPDVLALCEFRATEPSRALAAQLFASGWTHQRTTADANQPNINAILIASKYPLRTVRLRRASEQPHRWLHVNVAAPQALAVLAVHVPNRAFGCKVPFLGAVTDAVKVWRGPQALVLGDTNSGRIGIDEETPTFNAIEDAWMAGMEDLGWRDAFRRVHAKSREFTWYSPNGRNGFRIDQAFLNPQLAARLTGAAHHWGRAGRGRHDQLSDHAALVLDLDLS